MACILRETVIRTKLPVPLFLEIRLTMRTFILSILNTMKHRLLLKILFNPILLPTKFPFMFQILQEV
uniref:Uncharacterized protein n=1 Tax=uncultured microorganism TaxID=358574 RepID=I2FJK4_9ZZZZ|nr:hypothetical protein [uncultured microorganism]